MMLIKPAISSLDHSRFFTRRYLPVLVFHLLALAIQNPLLGQFNIDISKVGTISAPFLEIDVGSRAIGMGGAFVAVASDATALYWNPAGISRLAGNEIVFIHSAWIADINYDFVGAVFQLKNNGAIGISLISLSTDEMKVRTVDRPEGTGEMFSVGDLALGLAYARNLTSRFSIGFNGKFIQQNIWNMSATGFAIDIGTLFTTPFAGMKIGMSISNFGGKLQMLGKDTFINYDLAPDQEGSNDRIPANLNTDKFSLPLLFRVGLALDAIKFKSNRVMIAVDAIHPNDNTEYLNVGVEFSSGDWLFLRAGFANLFVLDGEGGLTLGGGMNYNLSRNTMIELDYSYQDIGRLFNAQSFSLSFRF
ncbi:MAG: PorV/PorQ family protein [Candidatus Marinimicrobia bacterium]|nr:PorV/PorQ family protein [Candidatus Neomarinimicrobiota bacterium]